ncbi:cytochrome b561 domain-containing protein At4g18260-like [Diospyros lotus]|uniref:cytochrome b561 domain-containing protein At4g18260-like n=1 Tax=Diospyros lotus TaxID=55363 RepID=UPI0022561536|nr:cytochrome b561 domain-containing protein At4g18260-like [Diospyros lotus]
MNIYLVTQFIPYFACLLEKRKFLELNTVCVDLEKGRERFDIYSHCRELLRMQVIKLLVCISSANLILLVLPMSVGCSSPEHFNKASNGNNIKHSSHKISDITVHGLLLWASMGFLMPLGILAIRLSNRLECGRWFKLLFYFHAALQTVAVLLATAGAVLSLRSFENSFNNQHQRIGLALYAAICVQAFLGFCRPKRGGKVRSVWYFVHWGLGTTTCVVGALNVYTGLEAYHKRTSRSTRLWSILFTAQIFCIAFLYLFQDKWEYMQKQGVVSSNQRPMIPTHTQTSNHEDLVTTEAAMIKTNSLANYFARSIALKKLFQLDINER